MPIAYRCWRIYGSAAEAALRGPEYALLEVINAETGQPLWALPRPSLWQVGFACQLAINELRLKLGKDRDFRKMDCLKRAERRYIGGYYSDCFAHIERLMRLDYEGLLYCVQGEKSRNRGVRILP